MGYISHNGPPSPWGAGETKKRIVDALKNENSDIHLYTGDISATGCAKVKYAKIQELYTPKHEMKTFTQTLSGHILPLPSSGYLLYLHGDCNSG